MTAVILFFALSAFALLVISLPFFKKLDEPQTDKNHRSTSIDGLRGFLAFAVVVNHFDSNLNVIRLGKWGTYHIFDGLLGEVGVALFFMITGYLFWGKLIASSGKTNWKILYIGRFFRIAPVYYVVLAPVLLIVGVSTGFHLKVAPSNLFYSLFKWLFIGFQRMTDINGFDMMRILGVIWTLHYEWIFYFSLLLTSFFIRKKITLVFCLAGLLLSLAHLQIWHPEKASWPLFFCGMLCAALKNKSWKIINYPILNSIVASLSIISVFVFFNTAIGTIPILLLLVFFFLLTNGATQLFGLLSLRGSKRLGHISYSLYLTHMVILYLFFNSKFIKNIAEKNDIQFWALAFPCTIIVLIISSLCYYHIEKGGIELGKKFIKKISTPKKDINEQEKVINKIPV